MIALGVAVRIYNLLQLLKKAFCSTTYYDMFLMQSKFGLGCVCVCVVLLNRENTVKSRCGDMPAD